MSSTDTDYLIRDRHTNNLSKTKSQKIIIYTVVFLLGAAIGSIPTYIFLKSKSQGDGPIPTPTPSSWNESDYQSNSDYYKKLTTVDFNQTHNLRLDRLSSPKFNPIDGKTVVYLRKQFHMPDLNGSTTTLHLIDFETNKTFQLTRPIWGINDRQFYWVDNQTILFLSNRGSSRLNQIFQLNLPDDINSLDDFIEPIQITNNKLSIDNLLVNRQGTRLAFSCQVYANLSIEETYNKQMREQTQGSFIYRFSKLFVRHWDEFMVGVRHHPFIVSIERDSKGVFSFKSTPTDILFSIDSDSPTRPFDDATSQWSFSASGNSFAYTRQHDEKSDVAWTTNLDIYTVDLTAANYVSVCVTCENLAADTNPIYSPVDDKILVYRSQSIPGYESDQFKLKLINGSYSKVTLLHDWDRSIQSAIWSNDGQSLYIGLGEHAQTVVYKLLNALHSNLALVRSLSNGTSNSIDVHPINDSTFVYMYESILEPANVYLYLSPVLRRPLTNHNQFLLSKVRLSNSSELFSFPGANNETVWGWHIPPSNGLTPKSPLAFLIHGGPHKSWCNDWSYRWNFHSFASQGYAVVAINFHGSDTYGQNFTDSINGEYGTLPFYDLQLGLDHVLRTYNYIDPNRVVALGISFGGYMINWIAGQPQMSKRFQALVNHDGLFDLRSLAYSTEELCVSEHDAGGFAQFENPQAFERFNPINYVANWTQPMLVIHGGRDYRVPDTQGISTFTALQRRGIPSRLLYFPNENHWTLNPFNSIIWYQEVLDWMNHWTK